MRFFQIGHTMFPRSTTLSEYEKKFLDFLKVVIDLLRMTLLFYFLLVLNYNKEYISTKSNLVDFLESKFQYYNEG